MSTEEVSNRTKFDARPSGSVFYRDWHFLTSRDLPGPASLARHLGLRGFPSLGLETRAFNFRTDPDERRLLLWFGVDPLLRRRLRLLRETTDDQNQQIHASIGSRVPGTFVQDPEVQDRLRALGYVN